VLLSLTETSTNFR